MCSLHVGTCVQCMTPFTCYLSRLFCVITEIVSASSCAVQFVLFVMNLINLFGMVLVNN